MKKIAFKKWPWRARTFFNEETGLRRFGVWVEIVNREGWKLNSVTAHFYFWRWGVALMAYWERSER
jgi:hypothetical protein